MWKRLMEIAQKETRLCAGLMSGTSLDGIDVAICEIGAESAVRLLYFETFPYSDEDRRALLAACSPATGTVESICLLNQRLGVLFGQAVAAAMQNAGLALHRLDFVASHGQTVFHAPLQGATLQIGELADIAAQTGAVTVGDFRPSDMAVGGQGAPLVPYLDYCLYRSSRAARVLINIGGIANLTALPKNAALDDVLAFDTGPGNVVSDNLMKLYTDGKMHYDYGGEWAAKGRIDARLLEHLRRADDYPRQPIPKSTGRERYTLDFARSLQAVAQALALPPCDAVATAAEYTALTIAQAVRQLPGPAPDEVYLSGGGIHNAFLHRRLEHHLGQPALPLSGLGMEGDAKEAVAFALLGDALLAGRPNNVPAATGAAQPIHMGKIAFPPPAVQGGAS